MNDDCRIISIGASAGGTQPIMDLIRNLSPDINAAIFIVQHIPAHTDSQLCKVLNHHTKLPVRSAVDGMKIERGVIYTAVSDYHLLVEENRITVKKGPRENRFRPSIDTLFRSSAYHYRERAIGVVLSGALNDGTSGMWAIKRFGGTSIIQSRDEALFDSMPASVKEHVGVDHELPVIAIGGLLNNICQSSTMDHPQTPNERLKKFLAAEVQIAKGGNAIKNGVMDHGKFSPLTCPDCHGALTEYQEGSIRRFRCHTGHGFTAASLMSGIDENIEKSMWEVMRGLEEGQLLLNHMSETLIQAGNSGGAAGYRDRAGQLAKSAQIVKQVILSKDAPLVNTK